MGEGKKQKTITETKEDALRMHHLHGSVTKTNIH